MHRGRNTDEDFGVSMIHEEKAQIVKKRAEIESALSALSYEEDCEPVVDLEYAVKALNDLEKLTLLAFNRINRKLILNESKRR